MGKKISELEQLNEETQGSLEREREQHKLRVEQYKAEINSLNKEIEGLSKKENEWIEK